MVIVTGGCSEMLKKTINVYEKTKPTIEGEGNICENLNDASTTTLTAKGGDKYKWSTSETTPAITVNKSGQWRLHFGHWNRF